MLQPYFAFGVPIFLVCLYLVFFYLQKKTTIHYMRLILLLIATFLLVFSFQVLQESWKVAGKTSVHTTYNPHWLWLPLGVGLIFTLLNLWLTIHQFISYSHPKK
ncbi:hypothetical protein ACSFB8_05705 [Enterococcus faecalis]